MKKTTTLATGMIVTVRPRKMDKVFEGVIVKYSAIVENHGVVWIENSKGDQFKFFEGYDEIEPIDSLEQLAAELAAWIEREVKYAGKVGMYGDDDYCEVIVEGSVYNVSASFEADGRIELSTVHRKRFKDTQDIELASANCRTVKTVRAAQNFIERYI